MGRHRRRRPLAVDKLGGSDGRVLSHPIQENGTAQRGVVQPVARPKGENFPANLPPQRVQLATNLYAHPHSPDGLSVMQSLTATHRKPKEGAPLGDLPPGDGSPETDTEG